MTTSSINWGSDDSKKERQDKLKDIGLLLLRVGVGMLMLFGHGFGKLASFETKAATFGDPLGLGSTTSLLLAIFAEFFCSIAIAFGFLTRLAVIPLIITMLTAALIVHADDPWGRKEMAVLYLVPFFTILIAGAGRYSLDKLIFGRNVR